MPIYDFYNKETDEVIENLQMTIADREQYLKDNPKVMDEIVKKVKEAAAKAKSEE